MDQTTSEAISRAFREGIFIGLFDAFKILLRFWWLLPVALFLRWANKKIDNWGREGRNKKFRGFSK